MSDPKKSNTGKKTHRKHSSKSKKECSDSISDIKSKKSSKKKRIILSSSESDSDDDSFKKHIAAKENRILLNNNNIEKIDSDKLLIKKSTSKCIVNNSVNIAGNRNNEMIFFDIETTGTANSEVIEFGAIIVDKFTYKEIKRYTRLIKPYGKISYYAGLIHNITYNMLNDQPRFKQLAAEIYDLMHGRIWVGHSINSADIPILIKAFKAVEHSFPIEHGRIDTLPLIRKKFGKRAGDLKMATLGKYFGLGIEKHRALDDSIMTFEVLKCISLSHMLECEMPTVFPTFVEEVKTIDTNVKSQTSKKIDI
jgi:DNA polymerase III epsilon subunit-like protein